VVLLAALRCARSVRIKESVALRVLSLQIRPNSDEPRELLPVPWMRAVALPDAAGIRARDPASNSRVARIGSSRRHPVAGPAVALRKFDGGLLFAFLRAFTYLGILRSGQFRSIWSHAQKTFA